MKKYELVLLFADSVKSEDQEKVLTKVAKDVKDSDGKVNEKTNLGKKELAYEMKDVNRATFWHVKIELPSEQMSAFRRKLTLNDTILRFLLVTEK